jgi:hypothetical protein
MIQFESEVVLSGTKILENRESKKNGGYPPPSIINKDFKPSAFSL